MDIKNRLSYITSFVLMIILSLVLFGQSSFYLLHSYRNMPDYDYPFATQIWINLMHKFFNFDNTENRFNSPTWLYFAVVLILFNIVFRKYFMKHPDILNSIICVLIIAAILTIYHPVSMFTKPLQ